MAGLTAHLDFVAQHPTGYRELLRGAAAHPKVAAIVELERTKRLQQIVGGLPEGVEPTPLVMATLEGWLHFADGVQIAWLESRELTREQVSELCGRVLFASVMAAIHFDSETQGEQAQAEPERVTG
jgi:hypothetical protein